MIDLVFGTIFSWAVIVTNLGFLLYHWFQVARSRRLTPTNGAAIMFATGFLVLAAPQKMFALDTSALNGLSWIGITMIVMAMILEIPELRRKDAARRHTAPAE